VAQRLDRTFLASSLSLPASSLAARSLTLAVARRSPSALAWGTELFSFERHQLAQST